MTWRRRLRRRLLWAGVLLGLALLLAAVSTVRVGIWARSRLALAASRIRLAPQRREKTMYAKSSFVVLAAVGALLLAAPASADRWGADSRDQSATIAIAKQPQVAMLDARERALGAKLVTEKTNPLDARERSFAVKQVAPTSSRDWFERFAAAHSVREPVVDDRFRIDPTGGSAPVSVTSSRELEWPQIGIGIGLGIALALGLFLAVRLTHVRPPVAR